MAGRFSHGLNPTAPPRTQYSYFVRGWSTTYIDGPNLWPRAWNVAITSGASLYEGVLRIDSGSGTTGEGWLKVVSRNGVIAEEPDSKVTVSVWNGTSLSFTRTLPDGSTQSFNGAIVSSAPRKLTGTFTSIGGNGSFTATRANVLSFGLLTRDSTAADWREKTRARIALITQGYRLPTSPLPTASVVTTTSTTTTADLHLRDDRPATGAPLPGSYALSPTIKTLRYTVSNEFDPASAPVTREVRVLHTVPSVVGTPLMIAFNGHGGFVEHLFSQQDNYFFYGDAFARRDYAVLGIESPHRYNDKNRFYGACPGNTCGLTCNATRPPIIFAGYSYQPTAIPCASSAEGSDYEEDGERLLDAQVAFQWYWSQYSPWLDDSRRSVIGLSLGGEIAAFTAAMTPSIDLAVVSGFSPDLRVMHKRAENHRCFEWFNGGFNRATNADSIESTLITEFLDESDIHSLIAPRPLIAQTSARDGTFSNGVAGASGNVLFASDKQVALRTKIAYGANKQNHVHTLFDSGADGQREHRFSAGLYKSSAGARLSIPVFNPSIPSPINDMSWQTNGATVVPSGGAYQDIFSLVSACYAGTGCSHVDCCP